MEEQVAWVAFPDALVVLGVHKRDVLAHRTVDDGSSVDTAAYDVHKGSLGSLVGMAACDCNRDAVDVLALDMDMRRVTFRAAFPCWD